LFQPSGITQFDQPFPHFTVSKMLDWHYAHGVLDWLERCDCWTHRRKDFYEQYEFELAGRVLPRSLSILTGSRFLGALVAFCEACFGERLFSGVSISAHKLVAGHYIGIHTDRPSTQCGMETHRLVLQLNGGGQTLKGGDLELFERRDAMRPQRSYPAQHNSGVGFKLSARSYHAVSRISAGDRYSLIFTFRGADGRTDLQILETLEPRYHRYLFHATREVDPQYAGTAGLR
jgi:hypothetical protein